MCPRVCSSKGLNRAQQKILSLVSQIQLNIRFPAKVYGSLNDLSEMLVEYFKQQDESFYLQINEKNGENEEIARMIEFLKFDLRDVKLSYLEFFEKYLWKSKDVAPYPFSKDFLTFSQMIITRFNLEEEYLFPLLAKEFKND